jgi:hypothetical protein
MKDDDFLVAGLSIAARPVEGVCRHLVNDRLERTEMCWFASSAEATLGLKWLKTSLASDELQQ